MSGINLRSHWIRWPLTGDRWYHTFKAHWRSGRRKREVEITISPTGRSVHVHVDGHRWAPVTSSETMEP